MNGVSAAASILAVIEATLNILLEKYSAYKHAQGEIFELYVKYRGAWFQIQDEIHIVQYIVDTLDASLLYHLNDQLIILEAKLGDSLSRLNRVVKIGGKVEPVLYTLYLKRPLKKTFDELEEWTARFKPSWYSTARTLKESLTKYVPTKHMEQNQAAHRLDTLRRSLQLRREDSPTAKVFLSQLRLIEEQHLPRSSAITAEDPDDGSRLVLDEVEESGPASPYALDILDVQIMADRLTLVEDPMLWGLLRCRGIFQRQEISGSTASKYLFVFQVDPKLSEPRSLRELLDFTSAPSLNGRIELARSLARSIMFVHNLDFVHKNIRPENILTFRVDNNAQNHRITSLVGFESFRNADGPTHQSQKQQWERDFYRHPSRQGMRPLVRYAMQHDIYSLGVCLLEIGLWTSFVEYITNGESVRYVPNTVLAADSVTEERDMTRRAYQTKEFLVQLARDELPAKIGLKYTRIVETCLCSWENGKGKTLFGTKDEFINQGGVLEGVRYSEKILLELENIVI